MREATHGPCLPLAGAFRGLLAAVSIAFKKRVLAACICVFGSVKRLRKSCVRRIKPFVVCTYPNCMRGESVPFVERFSPFNGGGGIMGIISATVRANILGVTDQP